MRANQNRLSILTQSEIQDYFSIPRLTQEDREYYFELADNEVKLIGENWQLNSQLYFVLQLGYFKGYCQLNLNYSDFLDHTLFWNAADLERKLADFQAYYNQHRTHSSLGGATPAEVAGDVTKLPIKLNNFRWQTHCRGIFQLPIAA